MSILTKAVLVKLSMKLYNPSKTDRIITNDIIREKQVKQNAGVWVKNKIDPKTLDSIRTIATSSRQEHYRLSLPWTDEGWRILPISIYTRYQEALRNNKKGFEFEVEKFLLAYPQFVQQARLSLNGMFKESDYLSISQLKQKFDFDVNFTPLPSSDDFRISLKDDDMEKMRSDVTARVKDATEQAMKDLWTRLAEPVKRMIDKLSDSDAIFRDSLVDNIKEIADLVPDLNVTEDLNLTKFAQECKEKLTNQNPAVLRENKAVRQSTAKQAEELLKKMEGYI